MFDVSTEEITGGSIPRVLVLLAAPLLVQNVVQVAQQVVDVFWLGRLGETAVAAVGLNFPVVGILSAPIVGVMVGTQVLVAERVGADAADAGRRGAVNGVALGAAVGLVLAATAIATAPLVIGAFDPGPAVAGPAVAYLSAYGLALATMAASDALEAGFLGWGLSRDVLAINVVAVAVNVGLDPVLIFGWGPAPALGVRGAALATAAGFGASFLFAVALFVRGREEFVLTSGALELVPDDWRAIAGIGWPNGGQFVASQGVRVVLVGIVAAVGGAPALAAYTVGARVASISFVPASGLQQAAQSVVGQNLGADRPDRARRTTWVGVALAACALSLIGTVQWLLPETLALAFVPDLTTEGLALTVDYLRILAYGYWAIGAAYLLRAGFNGARRTRTSMVATICQYWGVRLPIAAVGVYLLAMDVRAVFWAVTVSNVAAAVGLGLYYWYSTAHGMLEIASERAGAAATE